MNRESTIHFWWWIDSLILQEIGPQEYEGVAEYQEKWVKQWFLEADVGSVYNMVVIRWIDSLNRNSILKRRTEPWIDDSPFSANRDVPTADIYTISGDRLYVRTDNSYPRLCWRPRLCVYGVLDMRKRIVRSLDLPELIRVRSVYHRCLCKAN